VSALWGNWRSVSKIRVLCRFTDASYGFLECDDVYFSGFRINVISRPSRKKGDSTLRIERISSDTLGPLYIITWYHIPERGNIQSTVYFTASGCCQITSSVGRNTDFPDGGFTEFPAVTYAWILLYLIICIKVSFNYTLSYSFSTVTTLCGVV